MDELRREWTQGTDRETPGTDVVEHPSHQSISQTAAAEFGIGLNVGHHDDFSVALVVGNGGQPIVDVKLIAFAFWVVPNRVLHQLSVPRIVNLTAPRRP